ncbi:MAG: hypothetical protein PHQ95_02985 [Candidatus Gracilibacteria bacterium]|nr:hypothetical protein [Candidatus Gracilibacteria bacterium]
MEPLEKQGDILPQSHQVSGGIEVSNELARVGNMVVSIINHKNSGHIKRPLSPDNVISRLKIIVTHLTKGLKEKGEWIL